MSNAENVFTSYTRWTCELDECVVDLPNVYWSSIKCQNRMICWQWEQFKCLGLTVACISGSGK